ncbi:hypothetical protein KKA53_05405 [Candidatus Dependentiae bacterium]|nr:hypothetical protein [Candidatus Dependentiae bacterium]
MTKKQIAKWANRELSNDTPNRGVWTNIRRLGHRWEVTISYPTGSGLRMLQTQGRTLASAHEKLRRMV